MKHSKILMLILATGMTFFACKKDSANESFEPKTVQQPSKQTSNNTLDSELDPGPPATLYADKVEELEGAGYEEISIPENYVPGINMSNYSGIVLHLFEKDGHTCEVYKLLTALEAKDCATANGCTHKSSVNAQGKEECYETGSDCSIKVTTDSNGLPDVIIVCC